MKDFLNKASRYWRRRSLGLFILRLMTGAIFFAHGWDKIHDIPGVVGAFASLGVVAPEFFGPVVAWLEIVGGLGLMLGLGARIFGAALGVVMLFAVYLTDIGTGFRAHELELMLMAASFAIAFIGSGWISLWRLECGYCGGMLCSSGDDCPKTPAPSKSKL